MSASPPAAVDLYWIPLGAGGHSVRHNGRVYEALAAWRAHRPRDDLYHAALVVTCDGVSWTVEMAPTPDADGARRGVVGMGPVGSRLLGRWRLFRYEIRRWPGGTIPDLHWAVGEHRLSEDPAVARRLLALVPGVPRAVWGRDELRTGDMWNSNSLVAWLLVLTGLLGDDARPPRHGRAPGWEAGRIVAGRGAPPVVRGCAS